MNLRTFVAGGIIAFGLLAPTAALAAENDPYTANPPPVVQDLTLDRPTEVKPAVQTRGETLPVTGGDIMGLTIIGLAAIGAGTFLVRRSRLQPAPVEAS